jgi:hypothetical protein
MENHAKIVTNNAIGEFVTTVQQFDCTSILTILFMTAKGEIFCNKLSDLAKIKGAANFRVPRMNKPDSSAAMEKQDDLSKIDEILKDTINNVEEGKTLLHQPSVTCELIILFSCTSVKVYVNLSSPSF